MKYIFIFQFSQRDWISMLLGKGEQTLSDKRAANFRNVSFQRHRCKICRQGKFKSCVLPVRDKASAKSESTYMIIIMDVVNCPRNNKILCKLDESWLLIIWYSWEFDV